MQQEMALRVAEATVTDHVTLDVTARPEVHLKKGEDLVVQFSYQVSEVSDDQEERRFRLESSLDGRTRPPAVARWGDKWGRPDDVFGILMHRYEDLAPGKHELRYHVHARYLAVEWTTGTVTNEDKREVDGSITVIVE